MPDIALLCASILGMAGLYLRVRLWQSMHSKILQELISVICSSSQNMFSMHIPGQMLVRPSLHSVSWLWVILHALIFAVDILACFDLGIWRALGSVEEDGLSLCKIISYTHTHFFLSEDEMVHLALRLHEHFLLHDYQKRSARHEAACYVWIVSKWTIYVFQIQQAKQQVHKCSQTHRMRLDAMPLGLQDVI
jgi:hypothetical protein